MSKSPLYIKSFCKINKGTITLDESIVFKDPNCNFKEFIKAAYKAEGLKYPKFFKMDSLSKLAFFATEMVLKGYSEKQKENIGLVFANSSSSLDTDIIYKESIEDKEKYFPSPAVFVYTLPNICLGEISIKHQVKSEHAFFIFDTFNAEFMNTYSEAMIHSNKSERIVCGWVEYLKEEYSAFVYIIDKEGTIELTKENIEKLYK